MELKRVVVTGLGAITPLGNSINELWKNLVEGVNGCEPITRFDATNFKTKFACEVKNYDSNDNFERKEARRLDMFAQFAIIATEQAVQDSGINAENIVKYLKRGSKSVDFHFFTNNRNAYVNERALKLDVDITLFSREAFYQSDEIVRHLQQEKYDLIVLAGFLWLMPENIVRAFKGRIINIHPALLPKYGGKGMYGKRIHEAVVANHEKETGITIHYVDVNYDEGKIIQQVSCEVKASDTAEDVEARVHALEYEYYPKVIAQLLDAL